MRFILEYLDTYFDKNHFGYSAVGAIKMLEFRIDNIHVE